MTQTIFPNTMNTSAHYLDPKLHLENWSTRRGNYLKLLCLEMENGWVVAWHWVFCDSQTETAETALSIVEQFASIDWDIMTNSELFQLAYVVSLYIALKRHQTSEKSLSLSQIQELSWGDFSQEEVECMEIHILFLLMCHVSPPTALVFAWTLLDIVPEKLISGWSLILEAAVEQHEMALFLLSVKALSVALAAVMNDLHPFVKDSDMTDDLLQLLKKRSRLPRILQLRAWGATKYGLGAYGQKDPTKRLQLGGATISKSNSVNFTSRDEFTLSRLTPRHGQKLVGRVIFRTYDHLLKAVWPPSGRRPNHKKSVIQENSLQWNLFIGVQKCAILFCSETRNKWWGRKACLFPMF
jgi:hypothetical protein